MYVCVCAHGAGWLGPPTTPPACSAGASTHPDALHPCAHPSTRQDWYVHCHTSASGGARRTSRDAWREPEALRPLDTQDPALQAQAARAADVLVKRAVHVLLPRWQWEATLEAAGSAGSGGHGQVRPAGEDGAGDGLVKVRRRARGCGVGAPGVGPGSWGAAALVAQRGGLVRPGALRGRPQPAAAHVLGHAVPCPDNRVPCTRARAPPQIAYRQPCQ